MGHGVGPIPAMDTCQTLPWIVDVGAYIPRRDDRVLNRVLVARPGRKKHFLLNFKVFLHALSSKSTCGTKHSSLNRKLTYQKRVCKRSWTSTKRLKTLSKWRKEDVNPATNKRKLTDSQVAELLHPWSLSQRLVSRAV